MNSFILFQENFIHYLIFLPNGYNGIQKRYHLNDIHFKCPSCNLNLVIDSHSYICTNKHTYDISKHGYVNLVLVNQKNSVNPGDNAQMMQSRNAFLNKGYYKTLAQKLSDIINLSSQTNPQKILDIGCGEGYYLHSLAHSFDKTLEHLFYGIDISKSAIQLAAKRKIDIKLAVANAYNLPFFDTTFDTIFSIFSPVSSTEVLRLLSDSGKIIIVGPGEEHLSGLTKYIYTDVVPHSGNYHALDANKELILQEVIEIKKNILIQQEDILDFLRMTPYYWQVNQESKEKILELQQLETIIHFYIKIYTKKQNV